MSLRDLRPFRNDFMRDNNPTSAAKISGHPIHPMIAPFPIAFFVGAFVTDLVYWQAPDAMWETFSIWLITAGLIMSGFAALAGLIDFAANKRILALKPAWPHILANVLAIVLSLVNAFVHSRDAYTAVVPTGLMLSGIVLVVLLLTAAVGKVLGNRSRVGDQK
jgi:uncharacterized membrane protein